MNLLMRGMLALLVLAGATEARAQLGLSPSHFDLDEAQAKRTQSFRVSNFGSEPVRIRTELVPFDIDADGEVVEIAPNDRSLERVLAISPIDFEIPAGGSQAVRFALRSAHVLAPGEYRGMVYFRLAASASLGTQARLPISYRLGGAVYVQVGDVQRSAVLEDIVLVDGREAHFSLRSTGTANARMQGRYTVWTRAAWGTGQPLPPLPQEMKPAPAGLVMNGALPGRPVLPGKRVRYATPLVRDGEHLAAGDYVLHVSGMLEREALERTVAFRVGARGR